MGEDPYRRPRAALGAFALLLVVSACAGGQPVGTPTPTTAARTTATGAPPANLDQRIDAYIATLTPAQQIGQTLMLAVYADGYNADLDQALTQWHLGSAVVFPNYNGGPLMPTTLAGMQQLVSDLKAHADTPLLLATDAMDAQGLIAYMQLQGYADPAQGIAEACVRAFLAGDDLIEAPIEPDRLAATVAAMTQAVQSGRIPPARLHEALRRIIRLKVALGLLALP